MDTEVGRASMNMKEKNTANASRKTKQPAVLNANERLNKMKRHKCLLDLASWKSIVTLTRVVFMM